MPVAASARPVTLRLSAVPTGVLTNTSLWNTIGASTKTFFTHWCGRSVLRSPRGEPGEGPASISREARGRGGGLCTGHLRLGMHAQYRRQE